LITIVSVTVLMVQVRSMFMAVLRRFMYVDMGVLLNCLVSVVVVMVHIIMPVPVFMLQPLVPVEMRVVLR